MTRAEPGQVREALSLAAIFVGAMISGALLAVAMTLAARAQGAPDSSPPPVTAASGLASPSGAGERQHTPSPAATPSGTGFASPTFPESTERAAPAEGPGHPCADVQPLLVDVPESDDRPAEMELSAQMMQPFSEGGRVVFDLKLAFDDVVDGAYDPETARRLERLGFIAGYERAWAYGVGYISHTVYEFRDRPAAVTYQAEISRYACTFANEAFGAEGGGIGLQLRYAEEPRVREQVSWVEGPRRHVVVVAPGSEPSREIVLELYDRAREASGVPVRTPPEADE